MSTCRCCQYYKPEGRRGGQCQQLGVPVRGCWKACSIGSPAFDGYSSHLQEDFAILEHSLRLDCIPSYTVAEQSTELESVATSKPPVKAA
ncbi:hypothetical protein [Oscillatoria sp. FACHB-1406]|uniref:hypothetical protein n=1 Tax=Oscillatoria sp. FACHB-1406 TaxID=2692846 RepID=UPI001F55927F|nr:hypothetical protein [Oscillatoria sp. FACHB-1406]